MQQQDAFKNGAHHAHFESPDILVAAFNGPIGMDEVKRTAELYQQTFLRHGRYYLIADIGRSQIDAEGRKYLSEHNRSESFHGVTDLGADTLQKTFGKAIALALLFTGKTTFDTAFVNTVDEARAYIDQHRARTQRKAG